MPKRKIKQIRIYLKYRHKIYNYFWHRVGGNDSEAEDLTAECFLQLIASWDNYNSDRSEQSWLYGIARNLLCRYYREYGRELSIEMVEDTYCAEDRSGETRIDLAKAFSLIKELEPYHRDVLLMRHAEGLSNKEIADVMDKSEGSVRTQVSRATKILKDKLSQYEFI
jgi:RNA polymerase sigma-70 factor (ECF subfamily)